MKPKMLGVVHWCGEHDGQPAIIVTYYGGAALWRHENGAWSMIDTVSESDERRGSYREMLLGEYVSY